MSSLKVGRALSRVVASSGDVSRRVAQSACIGGRVTIDGKVCRSPAKIVSPSSNVICLDGRKLETAAPAPVRLWRYHKPPGLITSHADPNGRQTVFESLPASLPRVMSVGRLDIATEGLLLLTNSGKLVRQLEHPSRGYDRRYEALVGTGERDVTPQMIEELSTGITLGDGFRLRPIHASLSSPRQGSMTAGRRWVHMVLSEGKKNEVRRVWEHYGFATMRLIRIAFGPFSLGSLRPGETLEVAPDAVEPLLEGVSAVDARQRDPFDAQANRTC